MSVVEDPILLGYDAVSVSSRELSAVVHKCYGVYQYIFLLNPSENTFHTSFFSRYIQTLMNSTFDASSKEAE